MCARGALSPPCPFDQPAAAAVCAGGENGGAVRQVPDGEIALGVAVEMAKK